MNKLEEQLRASRHTEVTGLTPPPGGWEAISGQLANGAAGAGSAAGSGSGTGATAGNGVAASSATASGSTAAATGIKALAVKWIAGLGTTLLVGGGITYAVVTGGNPTTATTEPATTTKQATAEIAPEAEAATADPATAGSELIDATPNEVAEVTTDLSSNPASKTSPAPLSTVRQSGGNEVSAKEQKTEPSTQRTAAPTKPAVRSQKVPQTTAPPAATHIEEGNDVKESSPSENPTTENIPAKAIPATTQATTDQAPPLKARDATPGPERANNEVPPVTAAENGASPIPAGNLKAGALPTEAASSSMALLSRSVTPLTLTPALLSSSFTSPVATTPKYDPPKFGRNGKQKAPAYWEYHGSLSASYYQSYQYSAFYERQPGTGPFMFVLPTGETIRATTAVNLDQLTPTTEYGFYLKGGIDRQTSSGFLFRFSAGLSFYDQRKNVEDLSLVNDNQIREDRKTVVWSLPIEVGVHYTFLKRHRFRPYVGINMIGALYHNSLQESTFVDGQTMLSGISNSRANSFFLGGLRDIGVEAGIQYRLNNRCSVGILARASSDFHVFIPAAFGAEVRYSLK